MNGNARKRFLVMAIALIALAASAAVFEWNMRVLTRQFIPPAERNGKDRWEPMRESMVKLIKSRGVTDQKVLDALAKVERHRFVPETCRGEAYADYPLPIGQNQTISQPYIVALMSELLQTQPADKVLEIGTGSGYQAAVLAEMGVQVYSIEIVEKLGKAARARLEELGYKNVHVRIGDGYQGWPDAAPFDGIIVTAAPERVPQPLIDQLKQGGRMVIPVGPSGAQELVVLVKTRDGIEKQRSIPVRFVPMTGEAQKRAQ